MKQYLKYNNTSFILGRGSLEYLAHINESKIALVVDMKALEKGNFLGRVEKILNNSKLNYKLIANVKREPHINDLEKPIREIQLFKPDCIVAIGGGSVIDTAKAMWLFYEHPELKWEDAFKPFALPPLGKRARLIAVPTTSGTGSETTCVSVLVDENTKKQLMMSCELIPNTAILDYDLVNTMPSKIAAYSGLDALSHALEAAVCKLASPFVVSIATMAALEVLHWLPISVNSEINSDDFFKARETMHVAASMAGMAINNSSAGLSHGMDQPGPVFGLPHGLVCGILLPYTISFTNPNHVYVKLAKKLGLLGNEHELCRQLVDTLQNLNNAIKIPKSFKDCGISEVEFNNHLDDFINSAIASGATNFAPKKPDYAQMRSIFLKAYYGDEPY